VALRNFEDVVALAIQKLYPGHSGAPVSAFYEDPRALARRGITVVSLDDGQGNILWMVGMGEVGTTMVS
jgi:hypothetical protein